MMSVKEAYKNANNGDLPFTVKDHKPLLQSFRYKLVDSYIATVAFQSSLYALFKNEGKYGLLVHGWGNILLNTPLAECENWEDVDKLRDDMKDTIMWFDKVEEAFDHVYDISCFAPQGSREFFQKCLKTIARDMVPDPLFASLAFAYKPYHVR